MPYKNIQDVTNVYPDTAQMVRFRLNNGWDYVWITYHDVKGFITISSSFGNYAYIWSAMGEGVTLTEFFSRAHADYLAGKFFSDSKRDRDIFDFDQAIADLKTEILTARKEGKLEKTFARELYTEVEDLEDESDSELSEEGFYREYFEREALCKWNPEPYESHPGRKISGSYLVLRDEVIPLIKNYFVEQLKVRRAEQTQSLA